ncbi:MAG: MaoC family dehydratase [Deltaproteobacteria bacterium]|nr:MaoC family dehydratase [Deltaproteobacteria bacterium]
MTDQDSQPEDLEHSERHLRGLWFEDLQPGFSIHSPRRTITEADITLFAGLSGDFNPLHVDEPAARRTTFRGRIAHGLLIQSVSSGLINQTGAFHGTLTALIEMRIRYLTPVRAGDTIGVVLTVKAVDPEPGVKRGWVELDALVTNQKGESVIEGGWKIIAKRRPGR